MGTFRTAIACALSGALFASEIGAVEAAPLPTNVSTMKSMTSSGPIQVYWRGGWGWGWGFGAGAIAGAIIGGAIASSAYGPYGYYGGPYYYGYAYPYPYAYYRPRVAYYGYGPYYGYYRPYPIYRYRYYPGYW